MRHFFQWCDDLAIGKAICDSRILFPAIECVHILALTALLGIVVPVSLRLMGFGLRQGSARDVYSMTSGIRNAALIVMVITGFLLFSSEAMKCYGLPPFRAKMDTLVAAIVFEYVVLRSAAMRRVALGRFYAASIGLLSLVLWFGVGVAGRALGGHLKTGHRRTLQNRPTEQNQNKNIYTSPEVVRANSFPHSAYTDLTWAEDTATLGSDRSADSAAGMVGAVSAPTGFNVRPGIRYVY